MYKLNYIRYRKLKAHLESICFYFCRIFPVDKHLISVCTFEGKGGFGCNPKYIVQELHRQNPDYRFVWFVNKNVWGKEFPDYIKKVNNSSVWSRAYWLSRSQVWIDNYRKPLGTKKRKNQLYLNTWHGMLGFKTIGLWRGDAFSEIAFLVSENDSNLVDVFLADSRFTKLYFPKGLVYSGDFLMSGSPRCDLLINNHDEEYMSFRKKHNLSKETRCLMYAPTFRENSIEGRRGVFLKDTGIDFKGVLTRMKEKFGGEWKLCIRLHPQMISDESISFGVDYLNLSYEDDMNECLAAMDALITDYSSCAMDAALLHIPIFIYADDIEQYKENRGDFIWDIDENSRGYVKLNQLYAAGIDAILPFSIARNNRELEDDIKEFNKEKYEKDLRNLEKSIDLVKEGNASEKVAIEIQNLLNNKRGTI